MDTTINQAIHTHFESTHAFPDGSIKRLSVSPMYKRPWKPPIFQSACSRTYRRCIKSVNSLKRTVCLHQFHLLFLSSLKFFFAIQGIFLSSSSWPSTSVDASPRPKNRNCSLSLVGCCWGQVHSITGTSPMKPCSSFIDINMFLTSCVRADGS